MLASMNHFEAQIRIRWLSLMHDTDGYITRGHMSVTKDDVSMERIGE